MKTSTLTVSPRGTLRTRILTGVGALALLSLAGSSLSLYRITEVNRSLDAINRVSVPLGRLFVQIQSDADLYQREFEKRLGQTHWSDPHWKPRPIPKWIEDVLDSEVERAGDLIGKDLPWATQESRESWKSWFDQMNSSYRSLKEEASLLHRSLDLGDRVRAEAVHPRWLSAHESWIRSIQWGAGEYERTLRQTFSQAETRVSQLRTGLEIILAVVIILSLFLLWLGERALRPLTFLTRLAREIAVRGLRKEDKVLLPDIVLGRNDEVSQLAREFHRMATALLEREKTVENQKSRLQDQNLKLREMGELNRNILNSIESVLLVADLSGQITQCNPGAAKFLGQPPEAVIGTPLSQHASLQSLSDPEKWLVHLAESTETLKIEPKTVNHRVYGGEWMPLRKEDGGTLGGILSIEDLTEDLDIQARLRHAEKLAAVGQMSAQVAHEVRNPLHSIGLEAEMAAELASSLRHPELKQSLSSILHSVERLEQITENYLKLSRLSSGRVSEFDLGEALESVIATYSTELENQKVLTDWSRPKSRPLRVKGDRDLLEQALGNLLRNSLQALEDQKDGQIRFALGEAESGKVWFRIEDNGPGIAPEMRDRLFVPFSTTRAAGTGLGLSFVRKVIEDCGGNIRCLETSTGDGARFEIVLPQIFTQGEDFSKRKVTPPPLKIPVSQSKLREVERVFE